MFEVISDLFSNRTDAEYGQMIFDKFIDKMRTKWFVTFSYDDIARSMGFKDTSILMDGIGFGFRSTGKDFDALEDALDKLVASSGGKIPSKAVFDAALRDELTDTFTFRGVQESTDNPIIYVGAGIADEVLNGAQYVGDKVIETGKTVLTFAPILIIGGLAFYIFLNVKAAPKIPKLKVKA